jgi:magnesium-transporting ATPase (P-type)
MDTLGGLAFSGEPALDYYLCEPPKAREERILSRDMISQIAFTGGYTLLICVAFLVIPSFSALFRSGDGGKVFMTAFYALFVFMGLFNCFNTRSERLSLLSNIGKNKLFIAIMAAIAVIQTVIIYYGGDLFRSVPLTFREMLNVILIAASVIPFDIVRRIIKRIGAGS